MQISRLDDFCTIHFANDDIDMVILYLPITTSFYEQIELHKTV